MTAQGNAMGETATGTTALKGQKSYNDGTVIM